MPRLAGLRAGSLVRSLVTAVTLSVVLAGAPASAQGGRVAGCPASCVGAVEDMLSVQVSPGDPLELFVHVQTCVAVTGCVNRALFDDPDWFDRVVAAFVGMYVRQEGDWPGITAACRAFRILDGAACTDSAVRYHTQAELVRVLAREGCGTQRDWDLVGSVIAACLAREASWVARAGEVMLPWYRSNTRGACFETRAATGAP